MWVVLSPYFSGNNLQTRVNTGAISGGITGGVVALVLICFALRMIIRMFRFFCEDGCICDCSRPAVTTSSRTHTTDVTQPPAPTVMYSKPTNSAITEQAPPPYSSYANYSIYKKEGEKTKKTPSYKIASKSHPPASAANPPVPATDSGSPAPATDSGSAAYPPYPPPVYM